MPRGHHDPLYWVAVATVEQLVDMRTVHLSDGRICEEEERRERAHIELVMLPAVVSAADAQDMAQTIARYGPEADSAQRKMRSRAERLAQLVQYPTHDDDPTDDGAALAAA